jgi:hypothetical protein
MEIEFNLENLKKCLCPTCPVQTKCNCAIDELKIMQEITQGDLDSRMMIEQERIPALYCTSGKASFKGLETGQKCQCDECLVWKENNLFSGEPPGYFCREGEAREE